MLYKLLTLDIKNENMNKKFIFYYRYNDSYTDKEEHHSDCSVIVLV